MAATSDLDRVTMIVLRYMRGPIFVLIMVYAIGITGMSLIPGKAPDGSTEYMNLFHSFYFFTYTATTTGFGEIPHEFTDVQRLWAIFCLYMGVVAWLYAIGSIIGLVQNEHFLHAVNEYRFAKVVDRIQEPFFILCGFGDTGSLLARGLSDHRFAAVVVDRDPERIKALALRDYRIKMPGLCADASVPKHLVDAGIKHPMCRAVIALTGDEDVNQKIAVVARFMNPDVEIICRTTSEKHREQLDPLNDVTVINPFEVFSGILSMAITSPHLRTLNVWLLKARDVQLGSPQKVPVRDWVLCGYGRMGRSLHKAMHEVGIVPVIIDPNVDEDGLETEARLIEGNGDYKTLEAAEMDPTTGIVAGTDNDTDNLNILMNVRMLRPQAFTIVRQNYHENQLAFDAAEADIIMQSSLITARRILKHLISPQIELLIEYLRDMGEDVTEAVCYRLLEAIGDRPPHLWCIALNHENAGAAVDVLEQGEKLTLAHILRYPSTREILIDCVPLVIRRDQQRMMIPAIDSEIRVGDTLLFCGTEQSEMLVESNLNNPYTLHFLIKGYDAPRSYLFQWIERRFPPQREA